jgi:hypothetical protein
MREEERRRKRYEVFFKSPQKIFKKREEEKNVLSDKVEQRNRGLGRTSHDNTHCKWVQDHVI